VQRFNQYNCHFERIAFGKPLATEGSEKSASGGTVRFLDPVPINTEKEELSHLFLREFWMMGVGCWINSLRYGSSSDF